MLMQSQNQYDFIMNPGQPEQKKSLKLPGGSSTKGRVLFVVGLVVILGLVASLLGAVLSSQKNAGLNALVTAATKQHEMIRIAEIGIEKARGQEAKDIAVTTKLSLQSQQSDMLAAVQKAGKELGPRELAAGKNQQVDDFLTTADQNNVFDDAFLQTINEGLKDYQIAVEAAYKQVSGEELRSALRTQYDSANTLAGVAGGQEEAANQ